MEDFELIYYRHNKFQKAYAIPSGKIGYYDITLLFNGSIEYEINGKQLILNSGDILMIKKGDIRCRKESEKKVDYVSFNISSNEELDFPLIIKNCLSSSEVKFLIAACDAVFMNSDGNMQILSLIFSAILLQIKQSIKSLQVPPIVLKVKEFLRDNLNKKITLSDIGRLTYFSPVYCDNLFKKHTGKTIISYFIDEKIQEAKRLLTEGAMPLKQIAESLGFEDYNYFCRLFKKRTDYTPTQFKKSLQI